MLQTDELEMIMAAFPEVHQVCVGDATDNSACITVEAENEHLKGGTFSLKFLLPTSSSSCSSCNGLEFRISTARSISDVVLASDFETFLRVEFQQVRAERAEAMLSTFSKDDVLTLVMEMLQRAAQFDPSLHSSMMRMGSATQKQQQQQHGSTANNSGDDDFSSTSDEDEEEEVDFTKEDQDWSDFSKKQSELKRKREERKTLAAASAAFVEPTSVGLLEMHHIYCRYKRAYIVEKAEECSLQGLYLFGKPGRVLVEGDPEAVDLYLRLIKGIRTWQRCTEVGIFDPNKEVALEQRQQHLPFPKSCAAGGVVTLFEQGFGFQPVRDESHMKAVLAERGGLKFFHYAFPMLGFQKVFTIA